MRNATRYDRVVRTVMWLDAFLSVGLVIVCVVAGPIIATLGVPRTLRLGLGIAVIVNALLLAAFGAITAVVLMLRMRDGLYHLPPRLRLPLPAPLRPAPILGVRQNARRMTDVLVSR